MTSDAGMFGIPSELRELAEKGIEQARSGYEEFYVLAHEASGCFEEHNKNLHVGIKRANKRVFSAMDECARDTFTLASDLNKAEDIGQMVFLQTDYARTQLMRFNELAIEVISEWKDASTDSVKTDGA
nr:hypothetical protein [uncultured Cohaesibacter sp.]